MKRLVILACLLTLCLLIPQSAFSEEVYLSWFTNATASEFLAYDGYWSSTTFAAPTTAPSSGAAYGTRGNGINITTYAPSSVANAQFTVPSMSSANEKGSISFWICPQEDGSSASGTEHYIMEAGTPGTDGFRISWDNSVGKSTIRFSMSGGGKTTVCRADISDWQSGDWHHVQVAWVYNDWIATNSKGLAIWLDRAAVATCIYGGTTFMSVPTNNKVKLGGVYGAPSTHLPACYIDELIFRNWSDTTVAYRDFFLTAPYTGIEVTEKPFGECDPFAASPGAVMSVNSDNWVLCNKQKQFNVIGTRKINTAGDTLKEYILNYDNGPWGPWGWFDAKPQITWTAGSGFTHDYDGLITGGSSAVASTTLQASFRGMDNTKTFSVRSWDGVNAKPDLSIMSVARTPRYDKDAGQKWPNPGQTVTTTVYFGNLGTAALTQYSTFNIKYEIVTDSNNDFRNNETWPQTPYAVHTITVPAGGWAAGTYYDTSHTSMCDSVTWTWPATNPLTTGSVWIRVTLDSDGTLTEVCEANNQRCEKSNAKAFHYGYHKEVDPNRVPYLPENVTEMGVDTDWEARAVNLVGSFSDFDYCNAYVDRLNILTRATKWDTVGSGGIQDECRVDHYVPWVWEDVYPLYGTDPYEDENSLYDAGYPEILYEGFTLLDIHIGNMHELGHTALWLPDIYGVGYSYKNLRLGTTEGGTDRFPIVAKWGDYEGDHLGMWSSHTFGYPDELGLGYSPFMDSCHLWIDRMEAGFARYCRQYRPRNRDWYTMLPRATDSNSKNEIQFYAVDDTPLTNAAVYLYQMVNTNYDGFAAGKYFPDWPKFAGNTSNSDPTKGIYTIPTTTATSWDDWGTSTVEKNVACYSPFDYVGDGRPGGVMEPGCFGGELMLVRVVGYKPGTTTQMTEYHILPCSDMNSAFFKNSINGGMGDGGSPNVKGTYTIRTSLASPASAIATSLPSHGTPTTDNRPVSAVRVQKRSGYQWLNCTDNDPDPYWVRVNVPSGTAFRVNASQSTDGDSNRTQTLYCWWWTPDGIMLTSGTTLGYKQYTYTGVGDRYYFDIYVSDGNLFGDWLHVEVTLN